MFANVRGLWPYRDLVRNLVIRDLRIKYKGSSLGVAWSLLNPLVMVVVYTIAFQYVIRLQIDRFPVFLLVGLLPWSFFVSTLAQGSGSVADNGALVRKVAFPRLALPVATTTSQLVQFALAFGVFVPISLAFGARFSLALAIVPLVVALQYLFVLGLALLLATASVYFRDARHLLDVGVQVLFWLTPLVYSLELVPERWRAVVLLNPMAAFVVTYREAVLHASAPPLGVAAILLAWTAGSVGAGLYVFGRHERRFAEII
jgi:ABC-type polysaccharide/polyol phosphate export permease